MGKRVETLNVASIMLNNHDIPRVAAFQNCLLFCSMYESLSKSDRSNVYN
jgi:hypothetical protein